MKIIRLIFISLIILLATIYFLVGNVKGVASDIPPVADAGEDQLIFVGKQFVLDASRSYDTDDELPLTDDSYIWYENNEEIGRGINLVTRFAEIGIHRIILKVTDSSGLSSEDVLNIKITEKSTCQSTKTFYFPEDTICNKKWPSKDGKVIDINSPDYSCNLVEVCNEDLDFMIEDAINCCDGTPLTEKRKSNACNFANKFSNKNSKKCQGLYLIKALSGDQIYMQDYFEAEMCCYGVEELCTDSTNLYTARPLPQTETDIDINDIRCFNTPKDNPTGKWVSDYKIDLNNIALSDMPSHVSLNILSTGTCVDYSFSLTTLLRKAGYKANEVYSVETPNHAFNLIKFPGNNEFTVVDTTGNNDPAIVFGKVPKGYAYCENIRNCYNDNGEIICPLFKGIYGCEDLKESLVRQSEVVGQRIKNVAVDIYDAFLFEIKR